MTTNESIQYDCFRGCVVTHEEGTGETRCTYRAGSPDPQPVIKSITAMATAAFLFFMII